MKKLLISILSVTLCLSAMFAACAPAPSPEPGPGPDNPPAFVEKDLDFGVSFTNTAWADSEEFLDITLCNEAEARIYTNTDTNKEIVNGLKFKTTFDADAYAEVTADDVEIGALMCPVSEISDLLQFDDNDKIASVKLFEKANGEVKVNGFVQNGDVYELACHVRDIPADKCTLDIACVFYVKDGSKVFYSPRTDATMEVAALNSLNSGATYAAETVTTLEGLVKSETFTLTFDANGGSAVSSIKVIKGAMLEDVLANIESSLNDMQFVKWQMVTVGEDGAEVLADYNEETAVNEDIKLKAVFTNPLIATAEDFMAAMNAGAGSYTFTADIDLTDYMTANPWAGKRYFINAFDGNIDGAGHKLVGITGQSDGLTSVYGFYSTLAGTIENLYIELDVKIPAWNPAYGSHPFGSLAEFFKAEMSNCVISYSESLEAPQEGFNLSNAGLVSYFCTEASMENVLIIDRSTDPALKNSALITSCGLDGFYDLDLTNVVYVKTNGIDTFDTMLPANITNKDVENFYLVTSLADATVEGAGYVLSEEYLTSGELFNGEAAWTANTGVAAECLSVVTFADNKVMFGDIQIAEYSTAKAITTGEELFNLFNSGVEGSYYLANDIDMYDLMETEAYSWGVDGANGIEYAPGCPCLDFNATLDGRNHKITGIHGIAGGNANYGLIRNFNGKLTNCFIEINAGYADWHGTYGVHSFGVLANNFAGEISNCVINMVCYKYGASSTTYHRSLGLFGNVHEDATIKNILVIDDSDDATMEFRSLITSYAAAEMYRLVDVEDVVFVRTKLGITAEYEPFMNGFYSYLPAYKTTGVQDLYLADSLEEAITENGSYTLSDEFYNEENTEPNLEAYWEISSGKAMDCLSGITYKEGVVKLNGRAVYEVPEE